MITIIEGSYLFISSLLSFYLLIKIKSKPTKKNQIQDIHEGEISRLGGVIIVIFFLVFNLFIKKNIEIDIIIFSLIIILPAILEDIGFDLNPFLRLFLILLGSCLIVLNLKILPKFDFNYLNFIFNNFLFQIIFFTLALAVVINGQNIIDGCNGLSASTSIVILVCIGYLAFEINNLEILCYAISLIIVLFAFLLFNYPFGKIFLGDSGSYFIGLISGYLVIKIFAENPQLPTWSAVIILFYPTLEVVFSYLRKTIQKKSPFLPDNKHLHLKIYFLLSQNKKSRKKLNNALVAPFLGIIWLSPLALLSLSIQLPHLSLLILFGLILLYIFFYYAIPDPD